MDFVIKVFRHFHKDSLYRNSIYLMLSTFIMSGLGFVFWIINARIYKPEEIGIATTLISISSLIATFSLLGYNNALIRYLPTSKKKNELINSVFVIVSITSLLLAIIYIFNIPLFTPKLDFITKSIWLTILFIISIVICAVNIVSDSIFISYRKSNFVLVYNTLQSIGKIILTVLLFSLGSFGIYLAFAGGYTIALIMTFLFLILYFGYSFSFKIDLDIIKETGKFTLGNYIAAFIAGLPILLFPILITNRLGPKYTAFYYMPMMIANFLYIIPQAATKSLFAEGSNSEKDLKIFYIKAFKITSILLLPAIILIFFFGKYILLTFGEEYVEHGNSFLQILAISAIFISVNSIIGITLNIKHKIKLLVFINFITISIILVLNHFLISRGLIGVGIAFLSGQIFMSIFYFIYVFKLIRQK